MLVGEIQSRCTRCMDGFELLRSRLVGGEPITKPCSWSGESDLSGTSRVIEASADEMTDIHTFDRACRPVGNLD